MICNLRGLSELKRRALREKELARERERDTHTESERASAVIAAMTAICLSRRRLIIHVRFGESRVRCKIHATLRGVSSKSLPEEVRAEAAVAQKRRSMIQLIIINRLLRLHFGLEARVCQSISERLNGRTILLS